MKTNYLLVVLCLIGLRSIAQSDITISEWTVKPKIVNGNIAESESRILYNLYDSNTNMFFRIANDSNNIYLSFKITDKFEQLKILKSGMVVNLSSKGTKKIKTSISYPLPNNNEDPSTEIEPQLMRKQDVNKLRNEFKFKKSFLKLKGFATENGFISVDPNSFVFVGIDWNDKQEMYYDIIIPFTEYFGDNFVEKDLMSVLNLKVEVNEMNRPNLAGNNRPQGMPEGGSEGGGMRPGGGMRGGGRMGSGGHNRRGMRSEEGMGGSNSNKKFSSQKFTQKFKLTIK
ncbi:MAG: hypothetical protein HXX16_04715 [Bacteroidales bacterium]|nr:hypothetical protein [Bacteroidales bacterium]